MARLDTVNGVTSERAYENHAFLCIRTHLRLKLGLSTNASWYKYNDSVNSKVAQFIGVNTSDGMIEGGY